MEKENRKIAVGCDGVDGKGSGFFRLDIGDCLLRDISIAETKEIYEQLREISRALGGILDEENTDASDLINAEYMGE